MKIRLRSLDIQFTKSLESMTFADFSYFYGQMGAGKSSIARLIDFCLGGQLDLSPALQNEFVSAKLNLIVNDTEISLERVRDSDDVVAEWIVRQERSSAVVPARSADGVVIPETQVENLSDLLFHLSGITPPKVRRRRNREESQLVRLSIRNLLWFCYLDQDSMDSEFFNLESEAAYYMRNTAKDVLRYIIGFHQELVAQLEVELQEVHENRTSHQQAAQQLEGALKQSLIGDKGQLELQIEEARRELTELDIRIQILRTESRTNLPHHVDTLREQARSTATEILSIEDALLAIKNRTIQNERQISELQMLLAKYRRSATARSILAGVDFVSCPRCSQPLPERKLDECLVCGQREPEVPANNVDSSILQADADARIKELQESVNKLRFQHDNLSRHLGELTLSKQQIDAQLSEALHDYDSVYLSSALGFERRKAELEQTILRLQEYIHLSDMVENFNKLSDTEYEKEQEIRRRLKEVRAAAESDTKNLRVLESLFLDCLLRTKLDGISQGDDVTIASPHYLPEVQSADSGDLATTSFSNISSGGKKSLFKACFAIALHRLAARIGANLPTFMIIDSPMKNISERENQTQFESFHTMLYELSETELIGHQFIVIDKEYFPPPSEYSRQFAVRHMTPADDENPPLIPYYRGH